MWTRFGQAGGQAPGSTPDIHSVLARFPAEQTNLSRCPRAAGESGSDVTLIGGIDGLRRSAPGDADHGRTIGRSLARRQEKPDRLDPGSMSSSLFEMTILFGRRSRPFSAVLFQTAAISRRPRAPSGPFAYDHSLANEQVWDLRPRGEAAGAGQVESLLRACGRRGGWAPSAWKTTTGLSFAPLQASWAGPWLHRPDGRRAAHGWFSTPMAESAQHQAVRAPPIRRPGVTVTVPGGERLMSLARTAGPPIANPRDRPSEYIKPAAVSLRDVVCLRVPTVCGPGRGGRPDLVAAGGALLRGMRFPRETDTIARAHGRGTCTGHCERQVMGRG